MLQSYFRIAWRNLSKNRLYSLINMAGLTLGLAVGMLILLWVRDELNFDRFHHKAGSIYRVNAHIGAGSNKQVWNTTQAPVATYALKEVPGVITAVRIHADDAYTIFSGGGKEFRFAHAAYTDPSLFSMFDFKLIEGNPQKPFPDDRSVVLTRSTARKYFGAADPIGRILTGDHTDQYTVSGVVEDFPENSSIRYDMLFSMGLVAKWYDGTGTWKSLDDDWGNFGYTTFLQVRPGVSLKAIGDQLIRIQLKHAPWIKVTPADNPYELQPLARIHLYRADGTGTGMQMVRIFFVVAVLILVIACINYVNLSTARSMLRAKEVSVRKIIGAARRQLFTQFLVETVLLFCFSLGAAFALMTLLLPYYNDLSGKQLHLGIGDAGIWELIGITASGTLLVSAIYPALLLSSFEPLKALKGKLSLGLVGKTFRECLVTVQFVASVVLIIGTLVIGRQLKFLLQKDPGYDRSQIFTFAAGNMQDHLEAARAELASQPGILAVTTATNDLVNASANHTGGVDWDGKDPRTSFVIRHMGIDADFIPVLKMKLLAGKNFTGSRADSAHFILNETAVRMTGIKDPVGKRFKFQQTEGTIAGVLADYNFASLKDQIEPAVMYFQPKGYLVYIKTTGRDAPKAIAAAARLWAAYNPGFPFDYTFLDDDYAGLYRTEQRTGQLFNIFSLIAIFISCLGLFGLATYAAQVRTKEIGIRRVLGAGVPGIVSLISQGFLKLVLLAVLIAMPIAWWCMDGWLRDFAYRIAIPWTVFGLAGLMAILVAMATVSFQAIKAAMANPVESLRTE